MGCTRAGDGYGTGSQRGRWESPGQALDRRVPRQHLGRPSPQGSRPQRGAAPQPTRLQSGPSCSRGWPREGGTGRGQSRPAPHLLVPPCGPKVHQGLPLGVPGSKACASGPPTPSLHSLPSETPPTPASPSPSRCLLQPPLPTSQPWPSPVGGHVEPGAHQLQGQAPGGHSPGHTHLASPQPDHRPDMTCRRAAVTAGTGSGE